LWEFPIRLVMDRLFYEPIEDGKGKQNHRNISIVILLLGVLFLIVQVLAFPKITPTPKLRENLLVNQSSIDSSARCFPGTIILGRPTDISITFSFWTTVQLEEIVIQASPPDRSKSFSDSIKNLEPNGVVDYEVTGLLAGTTYSYVIGYVQDGKQIQCDTEHQFQTQKPAGSSFLFSIIADSHLGTAVHCDPNRYLNTLSNIQHARPDFLIALGDDFRADVIPQIPFEDVTNSTVTQLYLDQLPYFTVAAQDAALFNVNGNHECQEGDLLTNSCQNIPTWAITNRVQYYPNPTPNHFYGGNSDSNKCITGDLVENYYSWLWGDALFVVLDDYLYSTNTLIGWDFSLGLTQYHWMSDVLQTKANFKLLFHHHINGVSRGGMELCNFYEWGGWSPLGDHMAYEWDEKRPASKGWREPIIKILESNQVSIVFQGHDHLFTHQELEYGEKTMHFVTLPFPGFPDPLRFKGSIYDNSGEYPTGIIKMPAGHINVEVSPNELKVNYVKSVLSSDRTSETNGMIDYSFTVSSEQPH